MRDLTKSIASFSWAMSLFGMQQMAQMLRPGEMAESLDSVTRATETQLGDALRSAFRVGDQVQKGMVDITFSLLSLGGGVSPDRWAQTMTDALGCSGCAGRSAQAQAQAQETGWGPMPHREASTQAPSDPSPSGTAAQATGWGPVPAPRG
jgi:hypothetical protein